MRLLHTSDWHLGQSFYDYDREREHALFLDWLLDALVTEQADALLIAGDIFDNTNPSAASQRQLYRFLSTARERLPRLDVVLIAGNHDSAGRLEAPSTLLEVFGARVVGQVRNENNAIDPERLILPLHNAQGAVAAWCLAVPFLRPGDVPATEAEGDAYSHGVARLYRQALEHALTRRLPGQALIAMGHCYLAGGVVSPDSERRLVVGGSEALPVGVFAPELAYVALGHLHRAQTVAGDPRLRYCGSPLPLSFTEIAYNHQVLRIDLNGEQVGEITPIPVPRFVDLLRVPAQPAPLAEVLAALAALVLPEVEFARRPYVEARVLLDGPEPGLRARIDAALADKPVRLAKIESSYAASGRGDAAPLLSLDDLGRLQPEAVFAELYRGQFQNEPPPALQRAFASLLADCGEEAT